MGNKNIDINSENLTELKEKIELKDIDILKKDANNQNILIKIIDILTKSPLFEEKKISKWQILFDEWDLDQNLYIVKSWILSIEKYTTNLREETKKLSTLKTGDFLGEWWLKWNSKKEVLVKALEDSNLLSIDLKNWLKKFIEENPTIWYEILKHIILTTNERLNESNKIITTNYEIEKTISLLDDINQKSIIQLIEKITHIADVDYILFLEKHTIMPDYLILKYDSRIPNKILDIVFEKKWYFIDLDELYLEANVNKDDFIVIQKLAIAKEDFWYLIFWREKRTFSWSDKKVFSSVWNSFAWIIKKFLHDREEKNRSYIKEQQKNI